MEHRMKIIRKWFSIQHVFIEQHVHVTICKDQGLKLLSSFLIHQHDWNNTLPHCRNINITVSGLRAAVT
jgi:hypothetical protein